MLTKKLLFIVLALVLISGLISIGCAQTQTTPASTQASTPASTAPKATTATSAPPPTAQPKYGGVLKIISRGNGPLNLGIPGAAGSPSDPNCRRPAIETLMSLDSKGELTPNLATSWKYSSDFKSLTITLQKGVKFHDGTDFNAEAAKYCLDMVRTSTSSSSLKSVTSVDMLDDSTIRLNTAAFDASLLFSVQSASMIVSPTALKTLGDEAKLHPVGTGPFKFVSYKRDQLLKFEKFEGYWQKGKPYLDGIDRVFIADTVTAIASFKAGEGHIITDTPASDVAALKATGLYDTITAWSASQGFCGDSGTADSPFANLKVRRAIAHAIDNEAIAKVVGVGMYPAANQLAPPDSWYYNPKVVGYPYNPEKAKQLLTEAGYPSGFSTTITFRSDPRHLDVFTAVQSYLGKVGITAKLDAADSARLVQLITKGWNKQIIAFDQPASTGFDPGTAFLTNLSAKHTKFVSLAVFPDFDAKLAQANAEPDMAKRKAMFAELQKMVTDDYCMVMPIYIGANTGAKTKTVHDCNIVQYSFHEWNPELVWIDK